MRELSAIFLNEWIKLIRRRRFLVVLLLSFAVVGLFSFAAYDDSKRMLEYNTPEYQKQMTQDSIRHLEQSIQDPQVPEEHKEGLRQSLKEEQERLRKLEAGESVIPDTTVDTLREQNERLKKEIENLPPDQQHMKGQMQMNVMANEYRIEHNLLPENGMMMPSSWSNVREYIDFASMILMPLLAVLLVADMVSGEVTGGTIKLLLARPASRGKILFGKYLASVTATLTMFALMFALLLGVMFVLFGTDGSADPIVTNIEYTPVDVREGGEIRSMLSADVTNARIITISQEVFTSIGLALVASIGMTTLGFLCSTLVRSAAVSTGLAMGLAVIGSILPEVARGSSWLPYLITTHFNLQNVTGGQLYGIPMTLTESLMWLGAWTVLLYGVSHVRFTKQDFLG